MHTEILNCCSFHYEEKSPLQRLCRSVCTKNLLALSNSRDTYTTQKKKVKSETLYSVSSKHFRAKYTRYTNYFPAQGNSGFQLRWIPLYFCFLAFGTLQTASKYSLKYSLKLLSCSHHNQKKPFRKTESYLLFTGVCFKIGQALQCKSTTTTFYQAIPCGAQTRSCYICKDH